MALPKTTPANVATSSANEPATAANATTSSANESTTSANVTTSSANEPTTSANEPATSANAATSSANEPTQSVDLGQVLSDFMTSMREVQESVRADRERIEELQLANGLVIRQGAPDNTPPTVPPDDSYIDPAQFDPSNMDFKI